MFRGCGTVSGSRDDTEVMSSSCTRALIIFRLFNLLDAFGPEGCSLSTLHE